MSELLPRIVASALVIVLSAVLGALLGRGSASVVGALFGALIAVIGVVTFDTVRGYRLIDWLRSTQQTSAPRDAGLWGEVGYRVERTVRMLERTASQQRGRLEQFLSAIEALPSGLLLLDANDQIEWCNAKAADHFGLDPQRDLRQRITNLIRAPSFVDYMHAANFDEPLVMREPRGRGNLSVIVKRYDETMKLVLSQDLTEQERSEAMRRDFVANVSHEIRTPLTVLSGFLDTLKNLPLTPPERTRVLELMTQQAERMGHLVGDLLTLAQLEGSPRPSSDRWVDLDALLKGVEIDALVLSSGRHVLSFPPPTHVQWAGVESELRSAIANLVSNAVRYTPEGGHITVLFTTLANGSGCLAVIDNGIGIAREHISRLTERFYRVDGSRSRESGGTGLGLSIVKHVVQRHGGELDIVSEEGRGSTFRIMLPAVRVRHLRDLMTADSVRVERPAMIAEPEQL